MLHKLGLDMCPQIRTSLGSTTEDLMDGIAQAWRSIRVKCQQQWIQGGGAGMYVSSHDQWRIQDSRKEGAKSIAREARAQNFKPRPQLTRSWR